MRGDCCVVFLTVNQFVCDRQAAMSFAEENSHVKVVNEWSQDSHERIFARSEHATDVQHLMELFLDWALAVPLL